MGNNYRWNGLWGGCVLFKGGFSIKYMVWEVNVVVRLKVGGQIHGKS